MIENPPSDCARGPSVATHCAGNACLPATSGKSNSSTRLQGSGGAAFHPELNTDRADAVIRKGMNPAVDSYSAFFENDKKTSTGLAGFLQGRGCTDLTMVGLATDYCVAWSALDGAAQGFRVSTILSACRAIDLDGSLDAALSDMRAAGIDLSA